MMPRYLIYGVLAFLLASHVVFAASKPQNFGEQLNLAALLVKDKHYSRALGILLRLPLPEGEDEEDRQSRQRFHTLTGLAYLGLEQYSQAGEHFENALASGQSDPLVYVYLAQVYHQLKRHQKTLEVIEKATPLIDKYPALYEMKAQNQWALKQYDQAWRTLVIARDRFPKDPRFLRRQVFYLIEKKLYRQAADLGMLYLDLSEGGPKDYAALGNALRHGGQMELASHILEQGRLLYPQDTTLAKLLANTYFSREMPLAAAWIMEQAAWVDASLFADAAELYRRAGALYKALQINASVPDPKSNRRERVAILLALKRYEQVLAMHRSLDRVGLLQDDSIRYALAYAAYRSGHFEKAKTYLSAIRTPKIFRQASELRRLIKECKAEPWRCA